VPAWSITWYFLEQFVAVVHITLQTQLHHVLELIPVASAAGVILSIMSMELLQVDGKDWHVELKFTTGSKLDED
jgi:hypothetical protein